MAIEPQLLHITHANDDQDWVQGVLVPGLGLTDDQYWTRCEADPGALWLEALEEAVKACRYTLMIVSRAARVDQWAQLAARLAEHLGVEEDKPRLLLAALDFEPGSERACELVPLSQRCLDWFDCSTPERTAAALARLAAQLQVATTPEPPAECPYPGLRMFGADDPGSFRRIDLFFGRDEEGRAIVDELRGGGRALLVGPSGCGKSSLVRARVLPALGAMRHAIARPGAHPDAALRAALDALDPRLGPATDAYLDSSDGEAARAALVAAAAGAERLLYLDQLEEAFHEDTEGHGEHARFFTRLAALGAVPGLAILLGMRADFYGDLMRSPIWDDFKDHRVELAPLRGDPLRRAIARPAEVVGVYVEPDLVERLVREADQDRAAEALPLLQVALEQLWPLRQWRYLSLASYERLAEGSRRGLDVVLARHGDACIGALPEPEQGVARRVLIDLVQLGEGRPDTRRRRSAGELRRAGDDERVLARVLDHLAKWRLVAIGAEETERHVERHVDLAHDTLITGWPALTGWIAKRRDDLRTQRRLEARAAGGGLLADTELPELTRWVAWIATPEGQAIGASPRLIELVARSAAEQVRVQREKDEMIARLREEQVRTRQLLAQSYQETGRQLLLEDRPFASIPYLVEAYRTGADNASLRLLFSAAARHLPALLLEHQEAVRSAAFSPDGTRVVTVSGEAAWVWDVASGKPVAHKLEHQSTVWSAAFRPDGTRVLTASYDQTARVWDAATGKPLAPALKHQSSVRCAAFSPDGRRVITTSSESTARVWDTATGKPIAPALEHQGVVTSAAFSPDGTRVVTVSGEAARVWDAATGEPLAPALDHQHWVRSAAFSPDGTRVVTTSDDQTARVWDAAMGKLIAPALEHQHWVRSAAFSPDGTRVVTASGEAAWVWNAATGKLIAPGFEHQAEVASAAFSPDGTRVITASDDKTARIWDAATGQPLALAFEHQAGVASAAFSPDGTRIVTASYDRTARVWDAATDKALAPALVHQGPVRSAVFSPDGTRVVTASDDKTARVWDAATGQPLTPALVHQGPVVSAAFSPNGTRMVTASWDQTARVWDVATGQPLTPPLVHQGSVVSAAFSPDGIRVVAASRGPTARVWDAATGKLFAPALEHQEPVCSAAFNPDGTCVVTASDDNTARVWDVATGQPLTSPLVHQGPVRSAAFSPDGTRVVTASDDQTAQIWDAATGQPLTPALVHQGPVRSAAFNPDGTRVVTASDDQTARVWDAVTGKSLAPPLEHQDRVAYAAFSPDGTRVVTASDDQTARIWELPHGRVTPADWEAAATRTPYVLENGVLTLR